MGSTGSGRFGTYPGGGTSRVNGIGDTNEIECPSEIENIKLEDVATSDYYSARHSLPAAQSRVQLRDKIHQGRLVVESCDTSEIVGNVPVQYNYLLNCIKDGMLYAGRVVSSGTSPIPFIVVTLNA